MSKDFFRVALDLETVADRQAIPYLPDVKPKANLKDKVKIEADIKEKRAKQLADLGLNPHTNTIVCASFMDIDSGKGLTLFLDNYLGEKELLQDIWKYLAQFQWFYTFNGMAFDVECLKFHSMMHRVKPSVDLCQRKYDLNSNHIDIRMVLGKNNDYAKGSQDMFTRIILKKKRTGGGSEVQGWWDTGEFDKIRTHCEEDVSDLVMIIKRLEGYYI